MAKNEDQKLLKESLAKMNKLNADLEDLFYSTKELENNMERSNKYIKKDLKTKIKTELDLPELGME